ncbi:unnamed protein product [Bursaphelenchus xylophilus]|uniref:(pine wood nematode) hypothetical protein n=1 Tax=Bursaphelenchus xylophilus TaxID=6326 RepID=A0A1I7SL19_BURXY|nr:unnamed protein product [Bursaphelenchus xylophilus]CAG9129337.1 unnamed protein product [Bursaphelenchus xylophilus]
MHLYFLAIALISLWALCLATPRQNCACDDFTCTMRCYSRDKTRYGRCAHTACLCPKLCNRPKNYTLPNQNPCAMNSIAAPPQRKSKMSKFRDDSGILSKSEDLCIPCLRAEFMKTLDMLNAEGM